MKIIPKSFLVFFVLLIIIESLIILSDTFIANFCAVILYIIQMIWLYRIYEKTYIKDYDNKRSIKDKAIMIILSIIIFVCSNLSENGLVTFFIPDYSIRDLKIIEIITATILAPISEEILFRGIVLNQLMKKHSFLKANIIQAALFAILHLDYRIIIFLFFSGIVLGMVCYYMSMKCSILIHSLSNLTAVINIDLSFIELRKHEFLIIGIVFFIITALILLKIKTYREVQDKSRSPKQFDI